jgi:hypothetical protein
MTIAPFFLLSSNVSRSLPRLRAIENKMRFHLARFGFIRLQSEGFAATSPMRGY